MRTLLLLSSLVPACAGPITNDLFEEDADFLAALPSADRQTVHYAPASGVRLPVALPEGSPDLRDWTGQITSSVNSAVLDVLDLVDLVRAHPPTARTEDGRAWGPWDVGDSAWLLVEIARSGIGQYVWTFSLSDAAGGPWAVGVAGTHWAGTSVADGDGDFEAHAGTVAEFLGGGAEGSVAVDYDNREGIDLAVTFDDFRTGSTDAPLDASYDYIEDLAGNGDFQFESDLDVVEGEALEHVGARSRWDAGGALRVDARVGEGDLGGTAVTLSQCWSPEGALVYQGDDAGVFDPVGNEGECVFFGVSLPDGEEGG
jgi:hypothetical protein